MRAGQRALVVEAHSGYGDSPLLGRCALRDSPLLGVGGLAPRTSRDVEPNSATRTSSPSAEADGTSSTLAPTRGVA